MTWAVTFWPFLLQINDVLDHLPFGVQVAGYIWSAVGGVILYKSLRNGKNGHGNGQTAEHVTEVRESLARIETELGYRPTTEKVTKDISEGMSKVASQMTVKLDDLREIIEADIDRRIGPLERRLDENTRWINDRRSGLDDRRGQ